MDSFAGSFFIGVRLVCANAINRHGGFRVAIVSLAVEAIGLAVLWLAPSVTTALVGAALTGIGFSLVFPALARELCLASDRADLPFERVEHRHRAR